jgi:short-subunit dehydrogenase
MVNGQLCAMLELGRSDHPFRTSDSAALTDFVEHVAVTLARHGVRVADVLPGLIDTPLLDSAPNHSSGSEDGILARDRAPKEGPFRLISAREVAEVVWSAYHDEARKLHWYVPAELAELETAKAAGPEAIREMIAGVVETSGPTAAKKD